MPAAHARPRPRRTLRTGSAALVLTALGALLAPLPGGPAQAATAPVTRTVQLIGGGATLPSTLPARELPLGLGQPDVLPGGDVVVSDPVNRRVWRISVSGTATVIAGTDTGTGDNTGDGGPATAARLRPTGPLAVAPDGTIYLTVTTPPVPGPGVLTSTSVTVRAIRPDGVIVTVAGDGSTGTAGDGGPATAAALNRVRGLAVRPDGRLLIADECRVREVAAGVISTLAGGTTCSFAGDGGPAGSARFGVLADLAADATGRVLVADAGSRRLRQVAPDGVVTTVAGNGRAGFNGEGGPATAANVNGSLGVTVLAGGDLLLAEARRVLRVSAATGVLTRVAGAITAPPATNPISSCTGNGGPALDARMANAQWLALDPAGRALVMDGVCRQVRRITLGGSIELIAGRGEASDLVRGFGDGVPALAAGITRGQVAVGPAGETYLTQSDRRVRRIGTDGVISTVAGDGSIGVAGDGGPALAAGFAFTSGIAVGPDGRVYVGDYARVRRFTPGGTIETVAGTGAVGFSLDGGPATAAALSGNVRSVAVGPTGTLYLTDGSRVRAVAPDGTISTVAGGGTLAPEGATATSAALFDLNGISLAPDGSLLVLLAAEVLRLGPDGVLHRVAGDGTVAYDTSAPRAASRALPGIPQAAAQAADGTVLLGTLNGPFAVSPDGVLTRPGRGPAFAPTATPQPAIGVLYGGTTGTALDGQGRLLTLSNTGLLSRSTLSAQAPGVAVPLLPTRVLDTRFGTGAPWLSGTVTQRHLVLAGHDGVPAGAAAAWLSVTVINPAAAGSLAVWPTGAPKPLSAFSYPAGRTVSNLVLARLGTGGAVDLGTSGGLGNLAVDVVGYVRGGATTAAGTPVTLTPARLLDTRSGLGAPLRKVTATTPVRLQVAGRGGVPAGAPAAWLNLTATRPVAAGGASARAAAAAGPAAAVLQYTAAATVSDLVLVPLSAAGQADLTVSGGGTDLVADVVGYVRAGAAATGGTVVPVPAARVYDTRAGLGFPGTGPVTYDPQSTTVLGVPVAGHAGIPATAGSALLTVTVIRPTCAGTLSVTDLVPLDQVPPPALTFTAGRNATMSLVVPLTIAQAPEPGLAQLRIDDSGCAGTADVVVDVTGFVVD